MKKYLLLFVLFISSLLVSCGAGSKLYSVPDNSMVFKNNVYMVTEFPSTLELGQGEILASLPFASSNIRILDSVILVSDPSPRKGFVKAFSYPDMELLGQFGELGRAPGKFWDRPYLSARSRSSVVKDGNKYYMVAQDGNGRVIKVDIMKSIKDSQTDFTVLAEGLPRLFAYLYIDDNTYMTGYLSDGVIKRAFFRNDEIINSPKVDSLNESAKIIESDGYNHNLSAAYRAFNKDKGLVVEVPISLNTINIYSPDGKYAKSVCVERNVDDFSKIQKKSRYVLPVVFEDLRLYKDFFAVHYTGGSKSGNQKLLLFDYDGRAVAKLKLRYPISGFEFDVQNGLLYVFSKKDSMCHCYDVSTICK